MSRSVSVVLHIEAISGQQAGTQKKLVIVTNSVDEIRRLAPPCR